MALTAAKVNKEGSPGPTPTIVKQVSFFPAKKLICLTRLFKSLGLVKKIIKEISLYSNISIN